MTENSGQTAGATMPTANLRSFFGSRWAKMCREKVSNPGIPAMAPRTARATNTNREQNYP